MLFLAAQKCVVPLVFRISNQMSDLIMQVPFVDLSAQHTEVRTEIDAIISDTIQHSAFIGGNRVEAFEQHFATYCGTSNAIGVSDGTCALQLALSAIGVVRDDLVITVSHTFIATAEAIIQCGADVVFLEIDAQTYTLSNDALSNWLETECMVDDGVCRHRQSGRIVRAVVPVHLYGLSADMEPILAIARRYHLGVVEDACQAHGAYYSFSDGRRALAGNMGDVGCFSFYPGKNLGAMGEAGAVVTNDDNVAQEVRLLRDHGQLRKYIHRSRYGINGRLDAMQAGILDVKLRRLDSWNDKRRMIARYYYQNLAGLKEITLPVEPLNRHHVYHLFVILVEERDRLQKELQEAGISTGLHYPIPVHRQEAFADYAFAQVDLPVTDDVARRLLSLPMYPHMTETQAEYVVQVLRQLVSSA